MTDKPIRWGILGTGGIASTFATDLPLVEGAELAAVGSRTLDAATAFADRHGFARAHGSWAELAADPEVDVIYVATPHAFHQAAAMVCLTAGKAVLCEKPMTLDRASSDAAGARGPGPRHVFLMEAMWMRCNPAIRAITELVGVRRASARSPRCTPTSGCRARSSPPTGCATPRWAAAPCSTWASTR